MPYQQRWSVPQSGSLQPCDPRTNERHVRRQCYSPAPSSQVWSSKQFLFVHFLFLKVPNFVNCPKFAQLPVLNGAVPSTEPCISPALHGSVPSTAPWITLVLHGAVHSFAQWKPPPLYGVVHSFAQWRPPIFHGAVPSTAPWISPVL